MFGSEAVAQAIYAALSSDATITGVVGDRIVYRDKVPDDMALPACRFSLVDSNFSGPIGSVPTEETTVFDVVFVDEGDDTTAILPAAETMFAKLADLTVMVDGKELTFTAAAEYPLTRQTIGDETFCALGVSFGISVIG